MLEIWSRKTVLGNLFLNLSDSSTWLLNLLKESTRQ